MSGRSKNKNDFPISPPTLVFHFRHVLEANGLFTINPDPSYPDLHITPAKASTALGSPRARKSPPGFEGSQAPLPSLLLKEPSNSIHRLRTTPPPFLTNIWQVRSSSWYFCSQKGGPARRRLFQSNRQQSAILGCEICKMLGPTESGEGQGVGGIIRGSKRRKARFFVWSHAPSLALFIDGLSPQVKRGFV